MDVVGSEIGQKMRSAIKAKLTELGCYVDDELPDYVMVMVANKRTRAQMEDDLQLFLGDNTELFVNWLHQVLKKLQEVTVTAPINLEKQNERSSSKDRKIKEKKDKDKSKKSDTTKKSKKKDKDKTRKKDDKKSHKSKKKSKHHDMIRPNIPPLLMNIEKESEPSITDVFAGQILKNHGVLLETYKDKSETKEVNDKSIFKESKRPIIPIIDPSTISQPDVEVISEEYSNDNFNKTPQVIEAKDDQTKTHGLKQKLVEHLDSMSDDDDFLTIRTEAEELLNDFAEDVPEIPQPPPITPPLYPQKSPTPPQASQIIETQKETVLETLPHIELNLPKRPVRERLGVREVPKPVVEVKEKETTKIPESPERFTPEKEPQTRPQPRSTKSRLGEKHSESQRKISVSEDSFEKCESSSKRLTSKVSVLEGRSGRSTCASVVRVRPRPRVSAPASSLLLRAVADAHKSLLNIPPKVDSEPQKVKRAMVLPMRRSVEAQKIVIQVPGAIDTQSDSPGDTISLGDVDSEGDDKSSKRTSETPEKDDFVPQKITKVITNTEYAGTASTRQDDITLDTLAIHNTTVDKSKSTQFIVTMDGYHPNAFLAKKLMTEGLLDENDIKKDQKEIEPTKNLNVPEIEEIDTHKEKNKETKDKEKEKELTEENLEECAPEKSLITETQEETLSSAPKKRLSNASEDSDTQVIINEGEGQTEKRKSTDSETAEEEIKEESPVAKKRKASPIVFDVGKKEKETPRERTVSASSDSHVTLCTTSNSHKYDSLPPLSQAERKLVWCRAFPLCRYGSGCAFAHPRCKFAAACTRRGCVYSHSPNALLGPVTPSPIVASHVVPAANYKTISAVGIPNMCKFYPNCVNPTCHYYHPKPCRYGKACVNKHECNFYHNDFLSTKWKYSI